MPMHIHMLQDLYYIINHHNHNNHSNHNAIHKTMEVHQYTYTYTPTNTRTHSSILAYLESFCISYKILDS